MGIGNPAWPTSEGERTGGSLPLMGIGNGRLRVNSSVTLGVTLITPHGDRKRDAVAGAAAARRCPHYPSWGSETTRLTARYLFRVELITPHGDRKPLDQGDGAVPRRRLITPHGDRKRWQRSSAAAPLPEPHYPSWGSETPRSGRRRCPATSSHYPSWGSETSGTSASRRQRRISLPLMGIGNLS